MERQRMWLVVLVLTTAAAVLPAHAAQRDAPRRQQADEVRLMGEVTEIHAARVFTVRERGGSGREVMVLAPRPLQPGFIGATVTVEGALRRLTDAELRRDLAIGELTGSTRDRLVRAPVLVAHSIMAITAPGAAPAPDETPAPPVVEPERLAISGTVAEEERPLALRASMLVSNLEVFAGRQVRLLNGHVVGVLEPGAFLIEPATSYLKAIGQRDRVLVLIAPAALRVPEESFVGATVTVTGMVRSLLGMQVTREAPWPARLQPETVERLEVRAVILARSVETIDGTELTDRPVGTAGR